LTEDINFCCKAGIFNTITNVRPLSDYEVVELSSYLVEFEVVTVMNVKSGLQIVTSRSFDTVRRFGGMCRLHLQGKKVSQARNQ
jgi:hypothetical protein